MMNRRTLIQAASLLPLAASATFLIAAHAQGTGTAGQKRNRIVIQVSDADPGKWNLALNNARNLQEDVGAANVDIEVVAYGPGIGMLKLESPVAARIGDARKAGVRFLACENTMRGQKLTKDDMSPDVGYVPAGVTEIMTRQNEGWAYLRP
jgi:intracellular sulfur oxidation DsrE/DsrF family protein